MKIIDHILSRKEIGELKSAYGNYIKLTIDIEKKHIIAGVELHADGEKVLLENGSDQDSIWGGGISLNDKIIDTTAVLNLRTRLNNDTMEILNPKTRAEFIKIVEEYFEILWH